MANLPVPVCSAPLTDDLPRSQRTLRSKSRRRYAVGFPILLCLIQTAWIPNALAQTERNRSQESFDFARFVPDTTNFFLTIHKPLETDQAMRRANAWPFMALVAGLDLRYARDVSLHDAVSAFLGPESTIRADDLLEKELAFATDAWTEIGGAIWLVRLRDSSSLAQWFPQQASASEEASKPLQSFRTRDGLRALHARGVLALGRRIGRDSLLRHCAMLLLRRKTDALRDSKDYQSLMSYLPARALATAYATSDDPPSDRGQTSAFLPSIRRAVIGLYDRAGRFELAIRGVLSHPTNTETIPEDTFTRFIRLPQDTMFAAAVALPRVQLEELIRSTVDRFIPRSNPSNTTGADESNALKALDPQLILAAGGTINASESSPQIAMMIRSSDANQVMTRIDRRIDDLLGTVRTITSGQNAEELKIVRDSHLGVPIHSLSLAPIVEGVRLPSLALVADYEPAWASWGNWLIVALDRDHIKHIVDAQYGLSPRMASLPNVQRLNYYAAERSTIALIQPDLASDVLAHWLRDFDAGRPSLLDPDWWELPGANEKFLREKLGIIVAETVEPGVIKVGEVLPDTPAAGGIQKGDRIVGVNDFLLDFDYPEASLRRIHKRAAVGTRSVFRVLRGTEMVEVPLEGLDDTDRKPLTGPRPDDALRKLLAMLRTLQTVEFEVHTTRHSAYSAKLTLSFAKPSP